LAICCVSLREFSLTTHDQQHLHSLPVQADAIETKTNEGGTSAHNPEEYFVTLIFGCCWTWIEFKHGYKTE
jgi:hypothetical protein